MRFWLLALILAVTLPAAAHHPFTQYYDAAKQEVLTGVIVELRIINPHVVLIVDVSGPDARKGRWGFEGFPPHIFSRSGLDLKEKLQPRQANNDLRVAGKGSHGPHFQWTRSHVPG